MEERLNVFNKLGTAITSVALPAVIGTKMCINKNIDKGTISAECLDPNVFFKMIAEMGIPVRFNERIVKEPSFQ